MKYVCPLGESPDCGSAQLSACRSVGTSCTTHRKLVRGIKCVEEMGEGRAGDIRIANVKRLVG
jgi:hypothetical protein